jgi:glyoxylase-like metal-dependent hydrolase (beta-lactamase superfamily II)
MFDPLAVHAANPGPMTGAGNWTWLLRGRVATLIDAGTGEPKHLDALAQQLGRADLTQVLVTHGHTDHASGAPALRGRWPGARFRKMLWPERDAKWPMPWEPIADGDVVEAGDVMLTAVHTPGHAPDHLCFWHEESRSLFCGDLAVAGSSVWIPVSLQGDLGAYLASLERVLALEPARMYPAHGAVIDDPTALLRRYLQHRRDREEQVLDALARGDYDPETIVARVYEDLRESLLPLAREGVLANLIKLEREGRVVREGERWTLEMKSTS